MKHLPLKQFSIPLLLILTACQGPITAGPQGSRAEIVAETARQNEMMYQRMVKDQARVDHVAFPLLKANESFCEKKEFFYPVTFGNIYDVPKHLRQAAESLDGMGEDLSVIAINNTVNNNAGGLKKGDVILSINGIRIQPGQNASKAANRALKDIGYRPSKISASRHGEMINTMLPPPEEGCDYPVIINYNDNAINAYADGRRIVVSKGMLRFVESDTELAMVIAHELAHSALNHVNKMQMNTTIGAFGGLAIDSVFAGVGVGTGGQFGALGRDMAMDQYSIPFEQEADYVGMYFMARAGYSTNGLADFWRRMAAEGASSTTLRRTHPTSPERFMAIDHTAAEIAIKKKRKEPLVPNISDQ